VILILIVTFVTVALKLWFIYFGIAYLLDHFGKVSVILSQKTLMTNLCCFGSIFYLVFGRTELSTIRMI